jgi:hypothetical protein
MFRKINLKEELLKERARTREVQQQLVQEVKGLLKDALESDAELVARLRKGKLKGVVAEPLKVEGSATVFTLEQIRNVCVDYRLRFLDSKQYKGAYPYEALLKIRQFESEHGVRVQQFNLMAPAKMFRLLDPDKDPLLFANLGNGRYALIHQWGNDLAWYRKALVWPVKSLPNLLATIFTIAILFAIFVPVHIPADPSIYAPDRKPVSPSYMYFVRSILFLLAFLGLGSFAMRQYIRDNRNLSDADWDNKFMY